jgi:peptidyl-prolyl cis-trans isomerase A (cyclophilin A)
MKAFLLAALLLGVGLAGCGAPVTTTSGTTDGLAAAKATCNGQTRAGLQTSAASHPIALLATSKGCIVLELESDKAPITVHNFEAYANESFFDGVLFHRVIKDFMIQTGGMDPAGQFKTATHPSIKNEARTSGLKNLAYTVAMARMGRNADGTGDGADTATNQFFINHATNSFLDASGSSAGYAVFGHVIKGKEVVDAIATVPVQEYASGRHCQADSQPSCPIVDVLLGSVRIL